MGGESDKWVDDALKEATNKNMKVINLMEVLGDSVKEEELVEGMQGEEDEHEHEEDTHSDGEADDTLTDELIITNELTADIDKHDGDAVGSEVEEDHHHDEEEEHHHDEEVEGHHHDEGEIEYDEHVWLSLRNAQTITSVIAEKLGEADPDNAAAYKANAESYNKKLQDLDAQYKEQLKMHLQIHFFLVTDSHSDIWLRITELIIMLPLLVVLQKQRRALKLLFSFQENWMSLSCRLYVL